MHFSLMDYLKQKKQSLVFILNSAFSFEEGRKVWILKHSGTFYILYYILSM